MAAQKCLRQQHFHVHVNYFLYTKFSISNLSNIEDSDNFVPC